MSEPAARLYVLLARESPAAVVFRRGPSKQVLLLSWNTETDELREGQWLKGRIYERRGDLSPEGDLLIYFASSQKPPFYTWTAISRPPFLTALALWPKGDAWGGGGHFVSRRKIALNHSELEPALAEGYKLPKRVNVEPLRGQHAGCGEDDPVCAMRLLRDGWKWLAGTTASWEKPHPSSPSRYTLQMTIYGIGEANSPWYTIEHAVLRDGQLLLDLGLSDWADWSRSGDLLFAKDGSLHRAAISEEGIAEPREVANLNARTFINRQAPAEMTHWPRI